MLGSAMAKNTMRLTFGESRLICPNAERFMCSTLPTSSMKISSGFRASAVSDNEKTRISSPCFDDSPHFCGDRWELFQSRSEEHPSELQSLMHISSAVFYLKKTNHNTTQTLNK